MVSLMLNIRALHVSWGKMQGVFLHRRVFTQMKKETVTTNQITEGVIWKQLLYFFFPILFGTFFQQLYNTVDAIVVGRFVGVKALAAVGGSAAVLALLVALWRPLLAITVHEELAMVEGLPVAALRMTLMLLIAVVIAVQ